MDRYLKYDGKLPLHTFIYFLKHQNYGYEEMKEYIRDIMKDTTTEEQIEKDGNEIWRRCQCYLLPTTYNPYHVLCFMNQMYDYISWNKGTNICHRFNEVDKFDKDCICTEELFILISKYDLPTDDFEEIMTNLQEIDKLMRGTEFEKVYVPKRAPDVINLDNISSYEEWYAKDSSALQEKMDKVKEKRDNYLEEIKRREDAMRKEVAEELETQVEAEETQEATKTIQDVEPSEVETHYKEIAKILKPYVSHCSVDKIRTMIEYKTKGKSIPKGFRRIIILYKNKETGTIIPENSNWLIAECFDLSLGEMKKFFRKKDEDGKKTDVTLKANNKKEIGAETVDELDSDIIIVRNNHLNKINDQVFPEI